jgi:hypothetical protein
VVDQVDLVRQRVDFEVGERSGVLVPHLQRMRQGFEPKALGAVLRPRVAQDEAVLAAFDLLHVFIGEPELLAGLRKIDQYLIAAAEGSSLQYQAFT